MIDFIVIAFFALLSAYTIWGVAYVISLHRIKAKCRRLKRELDQAIAHAEKRIKDTRPQEPTT